MSYCGDPGTGRSDDWYRVTVSNKNNLEYIRKYFCRDAFLANGRSVIQVASFRDLSRANDFAEELELQGVKGVEVHEKPQRVRREKSDEPEYYCD